MNTKLFTLVMCLCTMIPLSAQENETIMEVSTVKRVTKKGTTIEVKEVKETVQEKGAVIISGSGEENQTFTENTKKDKSQEVLVDEVTEDDQNKALIEANRKREKEALEKSIQAEKAKAAAERKLIQDKKKQQQQELLANKKRLEKRGRKTGKLNKRRKNN